MTPWTRFDFIYHQGNPTNPNIVCIISVFMGRRLDCGSVVSDAFVGLQRVVNKHGSYRLQVDQEDRGAEFDHHVFLIADQVPFMLRSTPNAISL